MMLQSNSNGTGMSAAEQPTLRITKHPGEVNRAKANNGQSRYGGRCAHAGVVEGQTPRPFLRKVLIGKFEDGRSGEI